MVIYADVLLAVNWWVDFLLLTGVARMTGLPARVWRVVVAAFIGGLFSAVLFLPALPVWVTLLLKGFAAALMVYMAFGRCGGRRYIKSLLLLFGLSAGLAGLCSALYFYVAPSKLYVFNGAVYYAVSPWLLIGLTLVCYGLLTVIEYVSRRRAPQGRMYRLTIVHQNRSIVIRCLYDSGNHLVEPFSNRPVVVVERAVLYGLIDMPDNRMEIPPNGEWRVIPFHSVGGDGLLPAFLPDSITASYQKKTIPFPPCYVAVCDRLGRGDYQGLIGTALGDYLT